MIEKLTPKRSKFNFLFVDLNRTWYLLVCLYIFVICTIFLSINISNVTDYSSYESMYKGIIPRANWETAFVALNHFFYSLGVKYDDFRNLLFIFNLSSLFLLFKFTNSFEWTWGYRNFFIFICVYFSFVLTVYVYEFFVILIRSGLAIALISLSIVFSLVSFRIWLRILAISILLILAFNIHKSTTVILTLMIFSIGLNLILSMLNVNNKQNKYFFVLSILTVSLLYCLVLTQGHERIGQETAPLNTMRFIAFGLIPIGLFINAWRMRLQLLSLRLSEGGWVECFEVYYFLFSIGLSLLYLLGFTTHSGVVLVRLIDLTTFPALISIMKAGSIKRSLMSSYILLMNSLFFLATLNMYPKFVLDIMYLLGKS